MPNMKKYIAILFVLSVFAVFSSCGKDDTSESAPDDGPNEQTIIVFFPWSGTTTSNGLYQFVTQNVKEIRQAIIDNKGFSRSRFVCYMSDTPTTAVMYEMSYSKGKCQCDTLRRYSNQDFSKASTLEGIFTTAMELAPAERYGMIVGGHGSGWLPAPTTTRKKTRFIGGYSGVYATDTQVFAQALRDTGRKFQFILFDNCYMANIEVAYELSGTTDMMIASTSEIIERGIPYQTIFKYLVGTPDYGSLVKGFHDFYQTYTYPYGALSAIDCTCAGGMADLMKRINSQHFWDKNQNDLVQHLDGYEPPIFFDMSDYVHHLCQDDALVAEFDHLMARLVPYAQCTTNLYSELTRSPFHVSSYCGITISDPSLNADAAGKTETSWYKDTH